MPKYLLQATYTKDGLKGLMTQGGSQRRDAVERALAEAGVKMEAFYYAFGETDVFCIVDAPDNVSAIALSLSVNVSGADKMRTTVLITPGELDKAIEKSSGYIPPSQRLRR